MSTQKLPVSVVILTHRRDERFKKTVASAQWATEVQVLENKGAIEDFSALRNEALKQTTQPWVFFLDSDEIITPESVREIAQVIQDTTIGGVMVRRQDIFHGHTMRWGEVGNVWILRLGRRGQLRWERPVHEVAQVNGRVVRAEIVLHHYAHRSISEFWQKIVQYARLEALHRGPGNWWTIVQLLLYPNGKFLWNYFVKLGILDGMPGLVYAFMMSMHSLLVRAFQLELHAHQTTQQK